MNDAEKAALIEKMGRLWGMYSLTFPNATVEDRIKMMTFPLMTFQAMGAEEAVYFIRQNRLAINDAVERSAFAGDVLRDLESLDIEDPEGGAPPKG